MTYTQKTWVEHYLQHARKSIDLARKNKSNNIVMFHKNLAYAESNILHAYRWLNNPPSPE